MTFTHRFKVGDRVKLIDDYAETGAVENVRDDAEWICVEWDRNYGDKLTTISEADLLPADSKAIQCDAWLFECWKPGQSTIFATVDRDGSQAWPFDQWSGITRQRLVATGEEQLIHGVARPGAKP